MGRRPRPRHPAVVLAGGRHAHHRRLQGHRPCGHQHPARRRARRHQGAKALRDRQRRGFRLLPALRRRDRGPPRYARLLHDSGGRGPCRAHPVGEGAPHPQGGHGALHLRPPARLPDLLGQRRLRAAGHGRHGRLAQRALRGGPEPLRSDGDGHARPRRRPRPRDRGRPRQSPLHSPGRTRTPTSATTRRSASSARAAFGPARRSRAPSR